MVYVKGLGCLNCSGETRCGGGAMAEFAAPAIAVGEPAPVTTPAPSFPWLAVIIGVAIGAMLAQPQSRSVYDAR